MFQHLLQLPRSQAIEWLEERFESSPESRMQLVERVGTGRTMEELRRNRVDEAKRGDLLRLQELIAEALIRSSGEEEPLLGTGLTQLAGGWLREAEHAMVVERDKAEKAKQRSFRPSNYRYSPGPPALAFSVLNRTVPRGSWIEWVSPDMRDQIDATLARLAMRQHKAYGSEVQARILRIAETNPRLAGELAEEYLGFRARQYNPGLFTQIAPDPFGRKEVGIPLTHATQKANLTFLRDFANELADHGVNLAQSDAFVQAFIESHAITEVFQPADIRAVFGPVDEMSTRQIIGLTRAMKTRLGDIWRSEKANKEQLTRRGPEEIVESVKAGYETAARMLERACEQRPDDWKLHAFRGSLLHDKAQYAYLNNEDRAAFCAARDAALDSFEEAGWTYLLSLSGKEPANRTIEPFVAWLNVILGSSDLAGLTVEVMPDLRGHTWSSRLRDLRRLLESMAFVEELRGSDLTPDQLRAAVLKEHARAKRIDRDIWKLRGRAADERTAPHEVTPAMLRSLDLSAEEKSLLDDYEKLEERRKKSDLLRWHLGALCTYFEESLPELPPHMRQRYLGAGLKLIDKAGWTELPEGQLVRGIIADYEDVLTELRLAVEVDGSERIDPRASFGMMVKLQFTEEVEASSGGFSRYLVNETTESQYAGRNTGFALIDYRDNLERRIRNALEEDFLIEQIVFEKTRNAVRDIPNAKSSGGQEFGERRWREQALAYVVARPMDAAVDWIPRIYMDMTFNDGTGKVVLPVPSRKVKINCKPDAGASPVRRMSGLRITQIANPQKLLEENGHVELRISAVARGLIPGIDEMLDLAVPGFAAPVVTEAEPALVEKFKLEDGRFFAESRRGWVLEYRPDESLDREQPVFSFPGFNSGFLDRAERTRAEAVRLEVSDPGSVSRTEKLYTPELVSKVQRNMDYVTVPDGEPVALNPQEVPEVPVSRWRYLAIGLVGLLLMAIVVVLVVRNRRKEEPEMHPHSLAMPEEVNGFSILCLLRAIARDPSVRLSNDQRAQLAGDMRRIERTSFRPDAESPESDLAGIGTKWLELARR
ncbi:hypothetical protein [Haloferula sp. A504]|uniref:hypothetical protein n=1 Tax=Haloferula sp. A504 TaxID=3373601 RepID=UPI0031C10DF9|nr:hypothetical protein [Verrucomicrobiaceae bacterium E54]